MNYLWAGMILVGVVYATFTGRLPDVTTAALDSAKEAVTLCITMLGVMSFWMGLMKIAEQAGIIAGFTKSYARYCVFFFQTFQKSILSTNIWQPTWQLIFSD